MFKTIPIFLSVFIAPAFAGWEVSRGSESRVIENIVEIRHATDSIHFLRKGPNGKEEWFSGVSRLVADPPLEGDLKEDLSNAKRKIAALQSRLDSVPQKGEESELESVKWSLAEREVELKTAKGEIAKLKAEMDALKKGDRSPINVRMEGKNDGPRSKVVGRWTGKSIKNTETFEIKSNEWKISWDTKSGEFVDMNFQILVYREGREIPDVAANVIGKDRDSTIMRGKGRYHLTINSPQPYTVTVEETLESVDRPDEKPEAKGGSEVSTRKQVFWEIVRAEDRATAQAQHLYPVPVAGNPGYSQAKALEQLKKQAETVKTLSVKYKLELANEYGITPEELGKISVEGVTKNWPMP